MLKFVMLASVKQLPNVNSTPGSLLTFHLFHGFAEVHWECHLAYFEPSSNQKSNCALWSLVLCCSFPCGVLTKTMKNPLPTNVTYSLCNHRQSIWLHSQLLLLNTYKQVLKVLTWTPYIDCHTRMHVHKRNLKQPFKQGKQRLLNCL